jgi:hypothetical protein
MRMVIVRVWCMAWVDLGVYPSSSFTHSVTISDNPLGNNSGRGSEVHTIPNLD